MLRCRQCSDGCFVAAASRSNPCQGADLPPAPPARDRVLDAGDELRAFWKACDQNPGRALRPAVSAAPAHPADVSKLSCARIFGSAGWVNFRRPFSPCGGAPGRLGRSRDAGASAGLSFLLACASSTLARQADTRYADGRVPGRRSRAAARHLLFHAEIPHPLSRGKKVTFYRATGSFFS